jgi:hypothetical protein
MKAPVLFLWIVAALLVGGCAASSPPANVDQPANLSRTASLSPSQCWTKGCSTAEALSCPAIEQNHSLRQLACNCASGSSCITKSSE